MSRVLVTCVSFLYCSLSSQFGHLAKFSPTNQGGWGKHGSSTHSEESATLDPLLHT